MPEEPRYIPRGFYADRWGKPRKNGKLRLRCQCCFRTYSRCNCIGILALCSSCGKCKNHCVCKEEVNL